MQSSTKIVFFLFTGYCVKFVMAAGFMQGP